MFLRSRCASDATGDAGYSQPAQSGSDGMDAAVHRANRRQDRGAGGLMADIIAPAEQEGTKSVLKTWLKKVGDSVRVNDPVAELETDKVAVEIAAPADGVLSEIVIEEGADVEPGAVLGRIADAAAPSIEKAMDSGTGIATKSAMTPAKPQPGTQLPPGIRRLLEEHGLAAID